MINKMGVTDLSKLDLTISIYESEELIMSFYLKLKK
jgi:hypothetical protein